MTVGTDNIYIDYFKRVRETHGTPRQDARGTFVAEQLEHIRRHLVEKSYDSVTIDEQLVLAREASDIVLGPEPKVAEKPKPQATDAPAAQTRFSTKTIMGLIAGLVLAYVVVLALFISEGKPRLTTQAVGADAIPVDVQFVSIDLVRDTATLLITPTPSSPLVADRGKLKEDISVEIDTGDSIVSHAFKAGTSPLPWHAVIPFEYGDQLDFPFDIHSTDFHLRVTRGGSVNEPVRLAINKIAHGFKLNATAELTANGGELDVKFEVGRSGSVIFVTIISLISLIFVCASAVNVAWHVVMKDRKVEFGMLVWIAALLFVIPTVRNGLPGGPPHGALVDIALIFWLQFLTVGALIAVVWAWSRQ